MENSFGFCTTVFCKASWDLQFSRAPPVVRGTYNYRKNLQLSGLPAAVKSIFSCREHLQLSKVPPAVESTSTCPKYLQLRTPPVVESTSSCPKYLQLSRAPPVVQSTSSCREHLQLSKVSPVIDNISSYREYPQMMFTTNMIVYPCEQNQNWYKNGLAPVNTGKFTFQMSSCKQMLQLFKHNVVWAFLAKNGTIRLSCTAVSLEK